MQFKTIFISDTHLGTRACKADYLKDFIKNTEAETYYLVGDIIDGWALKGSWYWSNEMTDIVRLILKRSKKAKVYYIPGNHDEVLRDFLPDLTAFGNLEICNHATHTTLDGKKMVVLHGDIFDAFVSNKWLWSFGSALYDAIIWLNNVHHWFLTKLGAKYWSLAEWLKSHAREAINAIEKYEMACAKYAKNKNYDMVCTGHIHQAAMKEIDGIKYFNCGDWVSSCTAVVEELSGEIRIFNYKEEMLE